MKKLLLTLSTLFLFASCSDVQKIENGQIPDDYIDEIQPFLGQWDGSFEYHMGVLNISLNASNQLIVEFKDNATNDLIPGCETSIGLLKEVEFKDKDGEIQIKRATFDIDTNKCSRSILGQVIDFDFDRSQDGVSLKLVKRQWRDQECRIVGRDPNGAPIRQCDFVIRREYLRGRFSLSKN